VVQAGLYKQQAEACLQLCDLQLATLAFRKVLPYSDCAVHCYTLGRFDEAVMLLGEAVWDERREEGLCVNRGGMDLGWGLQRGLG